MTSTVTAADAPPDRAGDLRARLAGAHPRGRAPAAPPARRAAADRATRRPRAPAAGADRRRRRRRRGSGSPAGGPPSPSISYPEELPVSARRDDIAAALRDSQVVVVAGETGSGKTTQLPKIALELGRGVRGRIGHTQPRRIAARSVAERIAEELGTPAGRGRSATRCGSPTRSATRRWSS